MTTLIHSFLSFCYYCSIWPNSCKVSHQEAEYTFERLGKKVEIFFTDSVYSISFVARSGEQAYYESCLNMNTKVLLNLVEETKRFLYEPS